MAPARRQLSSLPTEIQLHIIHWLSTPALLQLTQASKHWHTLIDAPSQDYKVYFPRTEHPPDVTDLSFLKRDAQCFTHYYTNYTNVASWKDLCRCQALLGRNWGREQPITRETIIAPRRLNVNVSSIIGRITDPPCIPVWRFRPDFQRRFVLATTQHGGLLVTDMDSGALLWSLGRDEVRSYAHLEYSNGWCAFDRFGNGIEVWKHVGGNEPEGAHRGTFERITILNHTVETRGFQMLWPMLCVVSVEEQGFVYDLSAESGPHCTRSMQIALGAVGHIEQSAEDTVMYCMGKGGYHFHSKTTGKLQGILDPSRFTARATYHIQHEISSPHCGSVLSKQEPLSKPFPPRHPSTKHRVDVLPVEPGPHPTRDHDLLSLENDEWGAGLIRGDLMVAISKGGRCMICWDWPRAIRSSAHAASCTFVLELEIDAHTYDFGGWLGVQRGPPGPTRIIFEVDDKIYILRLENDPVDVLTGKKDFADAISILATSATCAPNYDIPISFMGVYDDCIMHTVLMGIESRIGSPREPYVAKAIRVLSFAPSGEAHTRSQSGKTGQTGQTIREEDDLWNEIDLRRFEV